MRWQIPATKALVFALVIAAPPMLWVGWQLTNLETSLTDPARAQEATAEQTVQETTVNTPAPETTSTASPSPTTASPSPTTATPTPTQERKPLMNAGGPTAGHVPLMAGGGCPEQYPVRRHGACYPD